MAQPFSSTTQNRLETAAQCCAAVSLYGGWLLTLELNPTAAAVVGWLIVAINVTLAIACAVVVGIGLRSIITSQLHARRSASAAKVQTCCTAHLAAKPRHSLVTPLHLCLSLLTSLLYLPPLLLPYTHTHTCIHTEAWPCRTHRHQASSVSRVH